MPAFSLRREFATRLFENKGDGTFAPIDLPVEVQIAPVQAFIVEDFNQDGLQDILLAGNNYATRAEWGRDNAGQGLLLLGQGSLQYTSINPQQFGPVFNGDVRAMVMLNSTARNQVIVAENNGSVRVWELAKFNDTPLAQHMNGVAFSWAFTSVATTPCLIKKNVRLHGMFVKLQRRANSREVIFLRLCRCAGSSAGMSGRLRRRANSREVIFLRLCRYASRSAGMSGRLRRRANSREAIFLRLCRCAGSLVGMPGRLQRCANGSDDMVTRR